MPGGSDPAGADPRHSPARQRRRRRASRCWWNRKIPCVYTAPAAKRDGILAQTPRALHIELPRCARTTGARPTRGARRLPHPGGPAARLAADARAARLHRRRDAAAGSARHPRARHSRARAHGERRPGRRRAIAAALRRSARGEARASPSCAARGATAATASSSRAGSSAPAPRDACCWRAGGRGAGRRRRTEARASSGAAASSEVEDRPRSRARCAAPISSSMRCSAPGSRGAPRAGDAAAIELINACRAARWSRSTSLGAAGRRRRARGAGGPRGADRDVRRSQARPGARRRGRPGRARDVVVDIGVPAAEVERGIATFVLEPADVRAALSAARPRTPTRGRYGHLLVVGGSLGKTGAAALGRARGDAGGRGARHGGDRRQPAADRRRPGAGGDDRGAGRDRRGTRRARRPGARSASSSDRATRWRSAPASGSRRRRRQLARGCDRELPRPMVVDADALTALAGHLERPARRARPPRCLTPHPGEMARMLGARMRTCSAIASPPCAQFATAHGVHVVLKGATSVIGGARRAACS